MVKVVGGSGGGGGVDDGGETTVVVLKESERLTLDCEVDAKPAPNIVYWTGPNGLTHNGTRMIVERMERCEECI